MQSRGPAKNSGMPSSVSLIAPANRSLGLGHGQTDTLDERLPTADPARTLAAAPAGRATIAG